MFPPAPGLMHSPVFPQYRVTSPLTVALGALVAASACAPSRAATTAPAPTARPAVAAAAQDSGARPAGGGNGQQGPRPYRQVVTAAAVTQSGLLQGAPHRRAAALRDPVGAARPRDAAHQPAGGVHAAGSRGLLRRRHARRRAVGARRATASCCAPRSTTSPPTRRAPSGARCPASARGPCLPPTRSPRTGPDSAAVVDVSDLFLSNIPEMAPVEGIVRNKSWVEQTWAFADNVNIEVTQIGPVAPRGDRWWRWRRWRWTAAAALADRARALQHDEAPRRADDAALARRPRGLQLEPHVRHVAPGAEGRAGALHPPLQAREEESERRDLRSGGADHLLDRSRPRPTGSSRGS